ncbi:MAG: glutathione S-transferase [Burkholderiaceae bacterium]|nr:glutathione S-transferase [Burkholderiaceae bacterium]
MIRIWGRLSSVNVQKVVWAACEAGVAFERIEAGGKFGLVKTPEYLAKNPNGLIPLLEDGDFVLWESNAIVRYMGAKYAPGTLYPEPLDARTDADRWMDWQATTLQPAMGPAFMQLIRTPQAERNAAAIDESARKTEPLMAILDAQLAGREFVCGARFTMADIVLGCAAHRWFGLPLARLPRPNVERWYAALMQRPTVDGVLTLPLT